MKSLFLTKSKNVYQPNILIKRLNDISQRILRKWADYLVKKSNGLSKRTLFTLMAIFCVSWVATNIFILAAAFNEAARKDLLISKPFIEHSKIIPNTKDKHKAALEVSCSHVALFKTYMDSLKQSPTGLILYQQITNSRPHLMDSVDFIIEQYHLSKN